MTNFQNAINRTNTIATNHNSPGLKVKSGIKGGMDCGSKNHNSAALKVKSA